MELTPAEDGTQRKQAIAIATIVGAASAVVAIVLAGTWFLLKAPAEKKQPKKPQKQSQKNPSEKKESVSVRKLHGSQENALKEAFQASQSPEGRRKGEIAFVLKQLEYDAHLEEEGRHNRVERISHPEPTFENARHAFERVSWDILDKVSGIPDWHAVVRQLELSVEDIWPIVEVSVDSMSVRALDSLITRLHFNFERNEQAGKPHDPKELSVYIVALLVAVAQQNIDLATPFKLERVWRAHPLSESRPDISLRIVSAILKPFIKQPVLDPRDDPTVLANTFKESDFLKNMANRAVDMAIAATGPDSMQTITMRTFKVQADMFMEGWPLKDDDDETAADLARRLSPSLKAITKAIWATYSKVMPPAMSSEYPESLHRLFQLLTRQAFFLTARNRKLSFEILMALFTHIEEIVGVEMLVSMARASLRREKDGWIPCFVSVSLDMYLTATDRRLLYDAEVENLTIMAVGGVANCAMRPATKAVVDVLNAMQFYHQLPPSWNLELMALFAVAEICKGLYDSGRIPFGDLFEEHFTALQVTATVGTFFKIHRPLTFLPAAGLVTLYLQRHHPKRFTHIVDADEIIHTMPLAYSAALVFAMNSANKADFIRIVISAAQGEVSKVQQRFEEASLFDNVKKGGKEHNE